MVVVVRGPVQPGIDPPMMGDAVKGVHHHVHREEQEEEVEGRPGSRFVPEAEDPDPPEEDPRDGDQGVRQDAADREESLGPSKGRRQVRGRSGGGQQDQAMTRGQREEKDGEVSGDQPEEDLRPHHGFQQVQGGEEPAHAPVSYPVPLRLAFMKLRPGFPKRAAAQWEWP